MAKIFSPSGETEFFEVTELQQAFEKELKTGEKVTFTAGVKEGSILREAPIRAELAQYYEQFKERILNPYVPPQPTVQRFNCINDPADYEAYQWIVGADPTNSATRYPPQIVGLDPDLDSPSLRIVSQLTYDGFLITPPYGQNWSGGCPVYPADVAWKFPWYEQFYQESTGAPLSCWNGALCNPTLADKTIQGGGCRIMTATQPNPPISATFRGSYNAGLTFLGGLTANGSSICTTNRIARPSNNAYTHVGWLNLSIALKNVNPVGATAPFSKYETVIQIGDWNNDPFKPWVDLWASPSNLISNVPTIGNTFTNVAVITADLYQPAYALNPSGQGLNCYWILQNFNFTNLFP